MAAVYGLTLVTLFIAAFLPDCRLWGVNWWGYYPVSVPLCLLAVGIVAPVLINRYLKSMGPDRDLSVRIYRIVTAAYVVVMASLFVLLSAQTHFLGDGYEILGRLSVEAPFIKPRSYGGILIPSALISLLGDRSEANVLRGYRIISVSAGIGMLLFTIAAARRLLERNIDRLLFTLGFSSCGFMLLFFGYVENYALLVLCTAAFCFMGVIIALGKMSRWWILPVLGLAVFLHIFGVLLAPAALYLLLARTRLGIWTSGLSRRFKWSLAGGVLIAAGVVFYGLYVSDYYFRFAFVPLFHNQFTVEGYTLLSAKHLGDYVNLLLLLVPGMPLVIAYAWMRPRRIFSEPYSVFLLLVMISALGAVFLLDPKLGMPRDWDLFAFAGVPLALGGILLLLDNGKTARHTRWIAVCVISLGYLVLFPRAVSQITPDVAVAHVKNYYALDLVKNGPIRYSLVKFLSESGDTARARVEEVNRFRDAPERLYADSAKALGASGKYRDAARNCYRVIEMKPSNSAAWTYLGGCLNALGMHDSALAVLEVAKGLNPYNVDTYYHMAVANFEKRDYDKAEALWLKALEYGDEPVTVLIGLVRLHRTVQDRGKTIEFLERIAAHADAPLEYITELGRLYLDEREWENASRVYSLAVRKGLDSVYLRHLQRRYPQLRVNP